MLNCDCFAEKALVYLELLAAYFFLVAAACFYGCLHSVRQRERTPYHESQN